MKERASAPVFTAVKSSAGTNDRMEAQAMLYVGVDLHRKRSVIAALDEEGTPVLRRRIESRPEAFQRVFGELKPASLSVAFEATYGWSWFADLLADAGIEAHMAHPLATKAIAAGRVKNDTVDARTLAHLLRTHLLPEGWIAPPEIRERRRLVRARTSLVRISSRLRCQIHSLLAEHCVHPPVDSLFGPVGRRFLATLELSAVTRGRIDAALRLIDASAAEVKILEQDPLRVPR
jgi:transposase